MDLPTPDPDLPHLADVVPSVLAAMGVAGFEGPILLPDGLAGACVLLLDGLGADLLDTYAADAPVLAGLRGQTLQVGFPSTTVAGLAAIGTGCRSGEHGMVGLSFRLPAAGVVNALGELVDRVPGATARRPVDGIEETAPASEVSRGEETP